LGAGVQFGKIPAASVVVANSTQIEAVVPAEPRGSVSVTVWNSGSQGATAMNAFTFIPAPLQIVTASFPVGTVGASYSTTLSVTGGTPGYTWSTTKGALPAGLQLNALTGTINGTPTLAGSFSFSAQVQDAKGSTSSAGFTLSVSPDPAPSISLISPNSGSSEGGTAVTISGSNFRSGAVVQFGVALAAAAQVVNSTQIQTVTPAESSGAVNVTVQDSDGQVATAANAFTFTTPVPASSGANYYVNAETGDDTYDGRSPTHISGNIGPWRTLHKAGLTVIAGATVHVADGTYEVNGTTGSPTSIETKNSGTAAAWITYVSDNKWGAKIINTNSVNAPNNIAWLVRGDYQIVKDFDISGGPYTGIFVDGNHVLVIGNHLHDISSASCVYGSFIYVNSPYQYVDSIGNVMHDGGMTPWPSDCGLWHGIYYGGVTTGPVQYGQISNNIIYRVSGYGIHFWHKVSHINVLNNLIFSNVKGGILIGASDGATNDYFNISNNMVIYNSNMIDNSHGPASLGWGISQYVNGGQIGPHNTYLNNLLYENHASNGWGGSWSNQAVSAHPTGVITGTITADPLLVNYQNSPGVPTIANGKVVFARADYHPTPVSPAKNMGDVSVAPATNIDGALREKPCDIGPY
jgi:hypothetical protein